ncbi:hypothetical protein PSTG_10358 [Puccinia striiformis f. sp. tritici PST-78]|uniref:Superoxide dismutase copper/zinc binding domain-containing protein n=1 Tax=Puccinia striiformis f. sp. tritici PST-78 TaxID=1165861 RepID=A0A0L0VB02_9BASI|nr:hypothetical protein PSTG_10358 [Puccinia striiformis f. sp. tritici PST-78]
MGQPFSLSRAQCSKLSTHSARLMSIRFWITLVLLSVIVLTSAHPQKSPKPTPRRPPYPKIAKATISTPGFHAALTFQLRINPKASDDIAPIPGLENHPKRSTRVFVQYTGVPDGQNFTYHIHNKAIKGKDCKSAGQHWNPTHSSMDDPKRPCDHKNPGKCESGDLSGKHGKLRNLPVGHLVAYYDSSLNLSYSRRGILVDSRFLAFCNPRKSHNKRL